MHPDANAFQNVTYNNACRLLVYTPVTATANDYTEPPKESHWWGPQPWRDPAVKGYHHYTEVNPVHFGGEWCSPVAAFFL